MSGCGWWWGSGLRVDEAGRLCRVRRTEPDLGVGAAVPRAARGVELLGALVALDLETIGARAVVARSGRVSAVRAVGPLGSRRSRGRGGLGGRNGSSRGLGGRSGSRGSSLGLGDLGG